MNKSFLRVGAAVCALALGLSGCGTAKKEAASESAESGQATLRPAAEYQYEKFDFSAGIDKDGFWEGIKAVDYVTLPGDYLAIPLRAEDAQPTAAQVEEEIGLMLDSLATTQEVEDRPARLGDVVNIDYIGRVKEAVFVGGTAQGYDLELGSGRFIAGFEDQLVGHSVGETVEVVVTFPAGYPDSQDEAGNAIPLAEQEAVFTVKINSIRCEVTPELTDGWVAENFADRKLETVQQLRDTVSAELAVELRRTAVENYLLENAEFSGCPERILTYQAEECLNYYNNVAIRYGCTLEEFVRQYMGLETVDDVLKSMETQIRDYCRRSLLYQAIAEKEGMTASPDTYDKYASAVDVYGKNYVMQYALVEDVLAMLADGATVK